MINDMFALASNWEENLCPTKCHKKDDQHVWAGSLPICQLYRTKKKSKYKGNDHLQKTHRNWSKTKKLQSPCYKTKKKPKVRQGPCKYCALYVCNGKQQIHSIKSQLFYKYWQKYNFPVEPKPGMCKLWYLCGDLCDKPSRVYWPNNKQIFQ